MADEFSHDVGRKLCLQLCSLSGYGAASDGTLDVLSDLVQMFLRESSTGARSYAENAGRTDINAKDIAMSLDDLGYGTKELKEFEEASAEVPFGATVPKFPVLPVPEEYTSFKDAQQTAPEHLPGYLPLFPEEHTYRETALYVNKQQDEKTRAIRAHEVKKTTEEVLVKLGKKQDPEDPYVSLLLEEETPEEESEAVNKRQRKTASNWTELLLGRLHQSEGMADPTSKLLPNTSLSSVTSFDSQEGSRFVKRRRKETKITSKEKKVKTAPAAFSAIVKFNLQPTPPDESVNENRSIATEELEPLPVVQEEGSIGTDDFDIFGGGNFPPEAEEIDSNDIMAESSAPGGTPGETQAPEEIEETRPTTSQSKSDA